MYNIVEFGEEGGGGIGLIRREWLTPRKRHCMWPPQKLKNKFNKCIDGSIVPETSTWEIYSIKRVFYETDNLAKAREKSKLAEIESEVNSDHNETVRKRKRTRKIYDSDSDDTSDNEPIIAYPTPPATQLRSVPTPDTSAGQICATDYKKNVAVTKPCPTPSTSTGEWTTDKYRNHTHSTPATSTDEEWATAKYPKQSSASTSADEEFVAHRNKKITARKYKEQVDATKIHSTPSTTDDECAAHRYQKQVQNAEESLQSISSLDLTITPFLKESPNSHALDVIAKHLARIEAEVRELQISQHEILQRLRSSSATPLELTLPNTIILPCNDVESMNNIETWISSDENEKQLVTYLSFVGGNKVPVIIRRILEKLFTNTFAVLCNWTGKNNKIALKDLTLIKIIRDAVRRNKIAERATDAEIHEVISNWFRFTKDRNGGREARRLRQ